MPETNFQGLPLLRVNGGLNTNASPINTESVDASELINFDTEVPGGLRKRRALDFLAEKQAGGFYLEGTKDFTLGDGYAVPSPSFYIFTVAETDTYQKYLILHEDDKFLFYKLESIYDLSEISTPFQTITVDPTYIDGDPSLFHTSYSVDRERLFILNSAISPGYFYFDLLTSQFSFVPITIFTRNLDSGVSTLVNHNNVAYSCLVAHTSDATNEPGEGEDWKVYWYRFGAYADDPDPETNVNRVSDWEIGKDYVTNIEAVQGTFTTTAFSSGRFWIAGNAAFPNTVYFSQTIDKDISNYGWMFSKADPINRYDSDPAKNDGGTLEINGMERIIGLTEFDQGLLIFASNGVWRIKGSSLSGGFTATDFSVDKVNDSASAGEFCTVKVEDNVFMFGYGGVFSFKADSLTGTIKHETVSIKIDNFYQKLSVTAKSSGKALYNPSLRKVYFLTNFNDYAWYKEGNVNSQPSKFKDALVFDIQSQAWTKYSLEEDDADERISIADMLSIALPQATSKIISDNRGTLITSSSGNNLTSLDTDQPENEFVNLFLFVKRRNEFSDLAIGIETEDHRSDFFLSDADKSDYISKFITAPFTFDNLINKKQVPYAYFVFERTETGTVINNEDLKASGCLFTTAFDWATGPRNKKYGVQRQIYRPSKWNISRYDGAALDKEVVTVKEKIRGRGNTVQFVFENDGSKDIHLYGMHLTMSASGRV